MSNRELEEFKKGVYENQDTAIKLLNENVELKTKLKDYDKLIKTFENFLEELEKDNDISLIAIGIQKKLIELKMRMIRGSLNE